MHLSKLSGESGEFQFLSPDPIIQAPFNGQNYNLYGYVLNNPQSGTDPTGLSSKWVQSRRTVGAIAVAVITYGAAYEMSVAMLQADTLAATANGVMAAGFASGGVAGGFEGAVSGSIFAALNFTVGLYLPFSEVPGSNIAAHAIVGCAQQATAGGKCGAGALAGGFSAAASAVSVPMWADLPARIASGAIASKLAGDTYENGALTAAFEYLFNALTELRAKTKNSPRAPPIIPLVDESVHANFTGFIMDLEAFGVPVRLTEAFRTNGMQHLLTGNQFGGAPYNSSLHEAGFAIDINYDSLSPDHKQLALERAKAWGLSWGGPFKPKPDPVHFYIDPFPSLAARQSRIRAAQREFLGP